MWFNTTVHTLLGAGIFAESYPEPSEINTFFTYNSEVSAQGNLHAAIAGIAGFTEWLEGQKDKTPLLLDIATNLDETKAAYAQGSLQGALQRLIRALPY